MRKLAVLATLCCLVILGLSQTADSFWRGGVGTGVALCTLQPNQPVLSNTTFAAGTAAGTTVGVVTAAKTGSCATTTLTLGGADAASFSLSQVNPPADLQTVGVLCPSPPCSYDITLTATVTGAIGSPATQPYTITATSPNAVTSVSLVNTSGSEQSTVLSPIFGIQFKKGDIASGQWPVFKRDDDDATCVYSQGLKTTWTDGSLKHLSVVLRCPGVLAASGTLQVNVFDGGSQPAASSRALSELSATNFQVIASGLINLTGTWNATVADAITNGASHKWISGQAGEGWIIDGQFKQSGAAHNYLRTRFYTFLSNDGSNNLGGIRIMPRVWTPEYDKTTAKAAYVFDYTLNGQGVIPALSMCHGTADPACSGGTTINFPWPYQWSTFTATPANTNFTGANTNYYSGALGSAGGVGMVPVILTNSGGALPAPLATGTPYVATGNGSSTTGLQTNTLFTLSDKSDTPSKISPTTACTGTCTVIPTLMVWPGGSVLGATSQAKWQYIASGGSLAADPTIRVKREKNYWHTTRMLPPIDMTLDGTITPQPTWHYTWDPVTTGFLGPVPGQTGSLPELGVLSAYDVEAFFTQTAADELIERTHALSVVNMNYAWRDSTSFALANMGNPGTTYTGFGTNRAATFLNANHAYNFTPGSNPPAGSGWAYWSARRDGDSWNHMPASWYFAYLWTGSPEILDIGLEQGNGVLQAVAAANCASATNNNCRNPRWPSQYYAVVTSYVNATYAPRAGAWEIRALAQAAGVAPDTSPEGIDYKAYFNDAFHSSMAYWDEQLRYSGTWFCNPAPTCASGGSYNHLYFNNGSANAVFQSSPWQEAYEGGVIALGYAITEDSAALLTLEDTNRWFQYQTDHFGDWVRYGYYAATSVGVPSTLTNDDSQWGMFLTFTSGGKGIKWTASSPTFDLAGNSLLNYTPAAGDKYAFKNAGAAWPSAQVPGGLSAGTPYYICTGSITGTDPVSFSLCPNSDGSGTPVTPTDTKATYDAGTALVMVPVNDPATGSTAQGAVGLGYMKYVQSKIRAALAVGVGTATGDGYQHANADVTSRLSAGGGVACTTDRTVMPFCYQAAY